MGVAVLFLGVGALVAVPACLMLLVVVISAPWTVIPIGGIAYLMHHERKKRIRAEDEAFARQLRESNERFYRELAEREKEDIAFWEDCERQRREAKAALEHYRLHRK
jgi:hypothetical protein